MTEDKTNLKTVADKNSPCHVGSLIKAYSEDALFVNQPRLTDLIPLSRWAYLTMFLVGVISICLLQLGYQHAGQWGAAIPHELFALSGTGTLASWVNSVMLLMLCAGCIEVYLLRRFKADDYKGRYKLWLWMAFFSVGLSFDAATGAHRILQPLVDRMGAGGDWSRAAVWWMIAVSLMSTYLGVRLFFELSRSPGSFTLLVLAAIGYGSTLSSRLPFVFGESGLTTVSGQSISLLSANFMVLMMTWIYARRVYLTAQGGRRAALASLAAEGCDGVESVPDGTLTDQESAASEDVNVDEPWVDEPWDDYDEEDEEVAVVAQNDQDVTDEYEEDVVDEYTEGMSLNADQAGQHEVDSMSQSGYDDPSAGTGFDEDAFWSGYDLTKMSRKQLRKMRKKLNRLKRQSAQQSDTRAA